jgi:hypothetical protein
MRFAPIVALACLLAACTPNTAEPLPSHSPVAAIEPDPSPTPTPTPPTPSHVFVIVMENRSYSQAIASSYIAKLASEYSVATDYRGVSHPSLPNYLAMTSGSTWGVVDDGWHPLPAGGLGAQLTSAGVSWRAYMEGMSNGCYNSPPPYALKHNPFAYYGSRCPSQVVPFTQSKFAADMHGSVPRFVWITPNSCNDGHDCSDAVAERWLAQTVGTILGSDAWKQNGLLLITWDEGEDSSNSVVTLVIHPNPLIHKSSLPYDHYSLLATIEDRLGVSRLGLAAEANAMTDLLATQQPAPLRVRGK